MRHQIAKMANPGRISRLSVAQVAWASRPCALARVHGQDTRATLLASRARARRHRQSGDAPSLVRASAAGEGAFSPFPSLPSVS